MRKLILETSYKADACHIGSALSCVEILQAIHEVKKKDDYFIFAKASGVATYYCLLAEKGIIPKRNLSFYLMKYPLASKEVPGVIHSVGSVGHGLSIAVGLAYADREKNVYCLIGDGELNEGSVWEAIMFAGHHKLNNLKVIVDYNKLQACGKVKDIIDLHPIAEKFRAFRWNARTLNGHSVKELKDYLTKSHKRSKIIIAKTVKGKGVKFLENSVHSHYSNLTANSLKRALKNL